MLLRSLLVLLWAYAHAHYQAAPQWLWWEVHGREGSVLVAYEEHLNGGGLAFGMDLVRYAYNAVGFNIGRCLEFCAGPAFIGFALVAAGVCDTLALSDRNPEAVAAINETLAHPSNAWLAGRVQPYLSDGLEAIPSHEMWDLVVANPPHFGSADWQGAEGVLENVLTGDRGWALHRAFYAGVRAHLRDNGRIIFQENGQTSEIASFYDMIRAGGLKLMRAEPSVAPATREMMYLESVRDDATFGPPGRAFAATAPATPAVWARCASHKPARPRAPAALPVRVAVGNASATYFYDVGGTCDAQTCDAGEQFLASALGRETRAHETAQLAAAVALARERAVDDDDARASDDGECRGRFLTTHDHDYPADMPDGVAWRGGAARAGWCLVFDGEAVAKHAAAPSVALPTASTRRCFPQRRDSL